VSITLPTKQFDTYAKRALKDDVSLPEIIRRDLDELRRRRRVKHHKPPDPFRAAHTGPCVVPRRDLVH